MKLTKGQVMVAKGMKERGTSVRQLAKQLGVSEGALRYRMKRLESGAQMGGRIRRQRWPATKTRWSGSRSALGTGG